jgi:hypothetical protein
MKINLRTDWWLDTLLPVYAKTSRKLLTEQETTTYTTEDISRNYPI